MKFWNKLNGDLYLYGEIYEFTAEEFATDLDEGVQTVHVNSPGGDVFTALAIGNLIRSRGLTVSVDGLAASAASLIAVSGKRVKMASNALMMMHPPATLLTGWHDADSLEKAQKSLAMVEAAIITTYENRAKGVNVREMLKTETWLNATQCQEMGFVDEIIAPVSLQMTSGRLFVNGLSADVSRFDDLKIKKALGVEDLTDIRAQVRAEELNRIKALMALKGKSAVSDALIDAAIAQGHTAAELEPYLAAVKSVKSVGIGDIIRDQMESGAAGVDGTPATSERQERINRLVNFANGVI